MRLEGYQGRTGQRDCWLGVATNQSQTAADIQQAKATTRSGPAPTQDWGSSAPRNCLVLRKVSSMVMCSPQGVSSFQVLCDRDELSHLAV